MPEAALSIVDAHQHFWHYRAEEYPWISDGMAPLRRNFLPADLERELAARGVSGAISVQARQSLVETEWLLALAEEHSFLLGVVGWVPLAGPNAEGHLERIAAHPKCKGVRHVLQDEEDERYLLRPDFLAGIGLLRRHNLVYDILVFDRHLPQTIEFADRFPDQVFVLDHIAKPRIREGLISPWRENIRELARRPNVFCKLSGMATEADWHKWTSDSLRPYFETVLEAFRPSRLMFGSDWPVLLAAGEYGRWLETVKKWIAPLSRAEQARLLEGTAREVYQAPPGLVL